MRRPLALLLVFGLTGAARADRTSDAGFGVGAGVKVAGDDVDPAVMARVAWESVALEPVLAVGVGKTITDEEALGYDASAVDRRRSLDAGLAVRVVLARRERLAFGVL